MTIKAARALGLEIQFGLRANPKAQWLWYGNIKTRDAATQRILDFPEPGDAPERVERWSWSGPRKDEWVWIVPKAGLLGFHDEPHFTRVVGANGETEGHSEQYADRGNARSAALRYFRRQTRGR